MAAGGLGGIVGTPADVCNVRMQDDGRLPPAQRRNYKNVVDAIFRIVRTEGSTVLMYLPFLSALSVGSVGRVAKVDNNLNDSCPI